MTDLISRDEAAIATAISGRVRTLPTTEDGENWIRVNEVRDSLLSLPTAQPEEVIPHRNYKYLSDYWCECGWHLGKKCEVKYCSECGRKVNWDE